MPTRQYVGARYVPKFATPVEHDSTRAYEALEIVTHLGTSYTSKKPVPVGTAISNTEYWVATGNYNAQVEQYRQEVANVQNDVDALETRVSLVDDNHYIIIGDSYGVQTSRGTSWAEYLEQFLGLTVARNNSQVTPATNCWDMCRGGQGFIGAGGSYGNWLDTITNEYPDNYDKNKVTRIVIAGGYNDRYSTEEEITVAINNFASYVNLNFPNAKVYLFCIGMGFQNAAQAFSIEKVYKAYKKCVNNVNWIYGTGIEGALHNFANLDADLHHPIPPGNIIIARSIKNIINGLPAERIEERWAVNLHDGDDYTVTCNENNMLIVTGIDGLKAYALTPYSYILTFSEPQIISNDTVIGTIPSSYFQSIVSGARYTFVCKATKSDDSAILVPFIFTIDLSGNLKIARYSTGFAGPFKSVEIGARNVAEQYIYTV